MDDPEMVSMLDELAEEAEKDFAEGKTITLKDLQAELGV